MYNAIPKKDKSVFYPWIDTEEKDINNQKIVPVEWNEKNREKLRRSIEFIRKTKEDVKTKGEKNRKSKLN